MRLGQQDKGASYSVWKIIKLEEVFSEEFGTVRSVQDLVKPFEDLNSKFKLPVCVSHQEDVQENSGEENFDDEDVEYVKNDKKVNDVYNDDDFATS